MSNRRSVAKDGQGSAEQILGLTAALDEANLLVDSLRGRTASLNAQLRVRDARITELQRQVAELSVADGAADDEAAN